MSPKNNNRASGRYGRAGRFGSAGFAEGRGVEAPRYHARHFEGGRGKA